MAASTLRLGPSFPSTNLMPLPNAYQKVKPKVGAATLTADGTTIFHERAQKWEWQMAWEDLTATELALVQTEYERTRTLALIDLNSASFTVLVQPSSFEVTLAPGTGNTTNALYNARIALREV